VIKTKRLAQKSIDRWCISATVHGNALEEAKAECNQKQDCGMIYSIYHSYNFYLCSRDTKLSIQDKWPNSGRINAKGMHLISPIA
jgi:hypothetical protein